MSHARDRRRQPGQKVMRARTVQVERLERRAMLSAAADPVVRPLMGFSLAGATPIKTGGAVAAVYAAVDGLGVASRAGAAATVAANALSSFKINWTTMKDALAGAPMEFTTTAEADAIILPLPTPDGALSRFKVVQTSMMEPGLAAKFPDIKTYRGVGVDDPSASLRLDFTPLGLHAQVLSAKGSYYVDPYFQNDAAAAHVSYYKRDAKHSAAMDAFKCEAIAPNDQQVDARTESILDSFFADATTSAEAAGPELTFSGQLRTYRAAVAATGEYTIAVGGGTVAGGQAAIVTAMNRVNGIYETELGIRMTLVANNSSIVYASKNDPYTNNNGFTMLTQNVNNLSSVIGNANFDIGHVFSTGGGGVAYLGVVGRTSKAGGVTGNPSPTGDSFWVDYVAHEMGHQFAANHTFNTSQDSNRNAGTAYEPGSGSTIMAYAGIEGSEDLQAHSDPYFHAISLDEIRGYVTGTIPLVGTITNTGNNAPTISAGPAFTIPASTPFILTATGSDPDGDAITYDWQEMDLGVGTLLTTADNGTSPILRDWIPSSSPSRIVPRLSNLLANTLAKGEKLPAVNRSQFKWRVIARDNKPGGGALSTSDVTLAVVNTGAAFAVTAPNTAVTWSGSSTQSVTWNVAGTTGSGINTANVKISLSTDGGNTWPHLLAASTPNDGSQAITLPPIPATSTARIKVEAVGNIFFDVSNASFSIGASVVQTAAPGTPVLTPGSDTGTSNGDRVTKLNNAPSAKLTFDIPGTVNGADVFLYSGTTLIGQGTGNGGTLLLLTNGSGAIIDGTYSITAKQQLSGQTLSNASSGIFILFDATAPVVTSPGNQTFEATDSAGSPIAFTLATIADNQDATPTLVHAPVAGSSFPIGTTSVTATGTDFAGNSSSTSFDVTVTDPGWLRRESGGAYHFTGTAGAETLHVTGGRVVLTASGDASRPGIALSVEGGTAALEASQTFSSLDVTGGSSYFDLATHHVAVNYTGGANPIGTSDGSSYTGLSGLVAAGRTAIGFPAIGSAAADNALTAVALSDADVVLSFSGPGETQLWHGQTVDATTVLLKYTYLGDANLDGQITGDDYSAIDFNLAIPGGYGYANGDFNLDGIISGDDYSAIDFNIAAQGLPL